MDASLIPFNTKVSDWPLAPIFIGALSQEHIGALIKAKVIESDDSEELQVALAILRKQISGPLSPPRQTIAYLRNHPTIIVIHSNDHGCIINLGLDDRISYTHEQVREAYYAKLQVANTYKHRLQTHKSYDYLCSYYNWIDGPDVNSAINDFVKRFSYRLYHPHPIDIEWQRQSAVGADCYTTDQGRSDAKATVRRLYTHPFDDSAQSDLVYEMDKEGRITTHSLLTIDVAIFTRGDDNTKPSLRELQFDQVTLNIASTTYGPEVKFGDIEYVSQRHAAHFFGYQRALCAKTNFDYAPEDLADGPYVLFEYVASAEQRFVQYFDQRETHKFHGQIYHPDKYKDETPAELAELLGYKRLYQCDVIIPKGKKLIAWAATNSRAEFAFTVEVDNSLTFPNEVQLVPTDYSILTGEQKQRYEKAEAIFDSGHYSYQGIVDLYNPERDSNNTRWLVLLAIAYSNPRDSFFDEQKAYDFQVKAAELGAATACYNLGVSWHDGLFGRVDVEKAKAWYLRAFNENNASAGLALFKILRKDPRYKDNASQDFKDEVDAIYGQTKQLFDGFGRVKLQQARAALSGSIEEYNPKVGITSLEELAASSPIISNAPVDALFNLAQRFYLGLDVPRDIKKAQMYLDRIPVEKGDRFVAPQTRNASDKLKQIIAEEVARNQRQTPQPVLGSPDILADFAEVAALITGLHSGQKQFTSVVDDVRNGRIRATPALSDLLWVASSVLGSEENPLIKQWNDLRVEVQLKQLGVTSAEALSLTQQYGPRYNSLNSRGYLVPASLDATSIPKDGDAEFKGLCAKPNGEIDFFFENSPEKPPMIFGEDIDLALIFAFHPSNQKLPWLSLEGLDEDFPDRPRWLFTQKQWSPLWIGRTLMGQTLYAVDFWVGELAWKSKSFPVSPADIPDPAKRESVIALLKEFELCGGAADGHSSRIMLKPGDVHGTWNRTTAGDIVCDIHRIDMGVDGSNIAIKVDPATNKMVEDRLLNLNDPKFAMGRVALLLTHRYDEIAEFFPMFERGRQLVGLLKTLVTLKEKYNFQPSPALSARIDRAYQYHTGKPPLTLQQRLCAPLSLGD